MARLKKGERYEVLQDMTSVDITQVIEHQVNDKAFKGSEFSACFTENDIFQIIRNLTDNSVIGSWLRKGNIIEIKEVEYLEGKINYIEFILYFKVGDREMYSVYQNPFGWNYIREEFLKKVKKERV